MSEEEGFFSRWSRRKRAAREAPPAGPEAAPAEAPPTAEPEPEPEAEPLELPPLESLTEQSDFRIFLRAGVPDAIRHAALRRLWSLDPAIRDFTNSLDYGWNFNAPDGGMAGFSNTLTGDIEKLLRQAVGMAEEAAREAEPEDERPPEPGSAPPAAVAAPAPDFIPPADAPPLAAPVAEEPEPPLARRRHGGAMPA